jgi:hypothetical protein
MPQGEAYFIWKKENRMGKFVMLCFVAVMFLGVSQMAKAQQPVKAAQLIGFWSLVEVYYTNAAGARIDSLGKDPRGRLRLDPDGIFTCQIMAKDLPKFKSNNRENGTAEENHAVMKGSISYYGTYKVNEAEQVLDMVIDACTFPNFDGVRQQRPFTLKGDLLTFTNKNSSVAGSVVHQTWKKIK